MGWCLLNTGSAWYGGWEGGEAANHRYHCIVLKQKWKFVEGNLGLGLVFAKDRVCLIWWRGGGGGPLTSGVTVFCSSITTFFRLSIRLATMVFWVSQVLQFPFWIPIYLCDIWREFSSSDFQPAQRLRQLKRQGRLEQWFLGYLKSCFRRQSTVGNLHFFHTLFYIRIYVTESLWTFLTNNR